jgi:hypothetical protein
MERHYKQKLYILQIYETLLFSTFLFEIML